MPNVTVAAGSGEAVLTYNVADRAYTVAQSLANSINATFDGQGTAYNAKHFNTSPANGGYLYAVPSNGAPVLAVGYQAVVVQNSRNTFVVAGGNAQQSVLGSNGGLSVFDQFDSAADSTTVVSGGGNNFVSFIGDKGAEAAYFANGDNLVYGGDGSTTIAAGTGYNYEQLGGGTSNVTVDGHDTIALGDGAATITVDDGGSAVVRGAFHTNGSGVSLVFDNGDRASTVYGGSGTYAIDGGAGGGMYFGGSGGHNTLMGGSGSATLFGGGAQDLLVGGSAGDNLIRGAGGNSTLVASAGGNDTLFGGAGADTLSFVNETGGTAYTVFNYKGSDKVELNLAGFDSEHTKVSGGSTMVTLGDSTKIVIVGYTGSVSFLQG